jgi:hypothetical protein
MERRTFFSALFKSSALALLPGVAIARIADCTMALSGVSTTSVRSVLGAGESLEPAAVPAAAPNAHTTALSEPVPVSSQTEIAARTVLLQTSPVAGFQYHQGELLWAFMRRGDRLVLVREPDNEYDDKAVRIDWSRFKLGYVPRIENHAVSQMLDRGEKLAAKIVELCESENPWRRVRVAIEVEA